MTPQSEAGSRFLHRADDEPIKKNPPPTLPETNIAPENRHSQKETIVFQPSIFRCYVSFREGSQG